MDEIQRRRFESSLSERLGRVYRGRRWIVALEVDQAAARLAAELRSAFGAEVLAVAARPGVGPVDPSVPVLSGGLAPAGTIVESMNSADRFLAAPGPDFQAEVDQWDPDRGALVLASHTTSRAELLGRPVFGARHPAWVALEDKLVVEELWRAAGLATPPALLVDLADRAALLEAHRRLASADGTVWAGDNRSGWHAGGEGTHWVPDERAARRLARTLSERHDRVRVMPFVDGMPCSIHGLAVDGASEPAVLRPCEMMVLRDRPGHRFVYARASTFWDPAPRDRAAMRAVARRIGTELMTGHGYRGFYTIDGILGVDGFVPTELNPRIGAALPSRPSTSTGGAIDLFLLHMAVIAGAVHGLEVATFEAWLVDRLDAERQAGSAITTPTVPDGERSGSLVLDPSDGVVLVEDADGERVGDPVVGTVTWGAGPSGGLLRVVATDGLPVGPPTAPVLIDWLAAIQRRWPIDLGPLEAAIDVR
jgi:hypothetical protein